MKAPDIDSWWKAILAAPGAIVLLLLAILLGPARAYQMDENETAGWIIVIVSVMFWLGLGYLIFN